MMNHNHVALMDYWFDDIKDLDEKLCIHNATAQSVSEELPIIDISVIAFGKPAPKISVRLDADERYFSHILCIYVDIVGTPSFVRHGSDYDSVNEVFSTKDKELKRKYISGFQGKHVVGLTQSRAYTLH